MPKILAIIVVLVLFSMLMLSCDKERIVTSTEIVHDIEYVQSPPDTIIQYDTVTNSEQVVVYEIDTLIQYDTTIQNITDTIYRVNTVYDTVMQISYVHDTIYQTNTVYDTVVQMSYVHDTVVQVDHVYDTVINYQYIQTIDTVMLVDTVATTQCSPNEHFAAAALEYYSDPLVLDMINQEFGIDDGWVLYLSEWQVDLTQSSTGTYDIYGYIDYWTPDWSSYYPVEYYWRLTYINGDPSDPASWQMAEPPATAAPIEPGLRLRQVGVESRTALK